MRVNSVSNMVRKKNYEVTDGWSRALWSCQGSRWEYKYAGEHGQYMRKVPDDLEDTTTYMHKIVFQLPGDPSPKILAAWEKKLKRHTARRGDPAVTIINWNTIPKGKRRKVVAKRFCTRCSEQLQSRKPNQILCNECLENDRRAATLIKKAHERDKMLRDEEMSSLRNKVINIADDNKNLKHQNEMLLLKLERVGKEAQLKKKDLDKVQRELKRGKASMSKVASLFMDVASIFKTFDANGEHIQQLHSLCRENQSNFQRNMEKNLSCIAALDSIRSGVDVKHGLFAKTLISDLYRVGIFYCSSKHRGYGNPSERRGNIMKYNSDLKSLIEQIIDIKPIKTVRQVEQGVNVSKGHLRALFANFGYNFDFATRDIIQHPRGIKKSLRQHPSALYDLYKALPLFMIGSVMDRDEFKKHCKVKENFERLFLNVYNYHRQNGQTQKQPGHFDYVDYDFYEMENIRISFIKEREERLHLSTYCTTRRYKYEEPNLIKIMH